MPRWIIPAIVVVSLALTLSLAGLLILARRGGSGGSGSGQNDPWAQDYGLEGLVIPPFMLIDQEARPVDETLFEGRITIIDFIFTHCPFVCPGMAASMGDLSASLKDTGVRFASLSVDPSHDTPARLHAYADEINADTARWSFLTGPPGAVDAICRDALGFALQASEATRIELPDGTDMANIVHPAKLILVGPDRRIIAMASFDRDEEVKALGERARLLDFRLRKK